MKAAVIGLGNMGKNHLRVYSELEGIEIAGASDVSPAAKAIADQYKCRFFNDYHELLKESFDAVSVVVPTSMHYDVVMDCLKAGKNVLVEKPISDDIEKAKTMVDEAKKRNLTLSVGHIERFNPAVQRLKELVKNDVLGKICSINTKRVGLFPPRIKDANVVIDLAVHDIDILYYILEKEPESMCVNGGRAMINREDFAEIFLKYKDCTGIIQVNWITPVKIRQLCITGTKGYAELNYINQELCLFKNTPSITYNDYGDFVLKFSEAQKEIIPIEKDEPLKLEIAAFIDKVKGKRSASVTGEDGLRALKIAVEAARSLHDSHNS